MAVSEEAVHLNFSKYMLLVSFPETEIDVYATAQRAPERLVATN